MQREASKIARIPVLLCWSAEWQLPSTAVRQQDKYLLCTAAHAQTCIYCRSRIIGFAPTRPTTTSMETTWTETGPCTPGSQHLSTTQTNGCTHGKQQDQSCSHTHESNHTAVVSECITVLWLKWIEHWPRATFVITQIRDNRLFTLTFQPYRAPHYTTYSHVHSIMWGIAWKWCQWMETTIQSIHILWMLCSMT